MFTARLPGHRSRSLPIAVLRWLWTLPTNLVGHGVGLVVCRRPGKRLDSRAARAWLYVLPDAGRLSRMGAVTLGHAVLASRGFVSGEAGRWALAHELSHARQHDWLGPAYLPAHILFQLVSVALSVARPVRGCSPQHAYNPLERVFLHVPIDVLFQAGARGEADPRVLDEFGV